MFQSGSCDRRRPVASLTADITDRRPRSCTGGGHIILTDIFFGIGALPASVAVLICVLIVLRPHARRLAETVLLDIKSSRGAVRLRAAAALAALVGAWGFTYWAANYNNREPTPIVLVRE